MHIRTMEPPFPNIARRPELLRGCLTQWMTDLTTSTHLAKLEGEEVSAPKAAPPAKIPDLMAALKASVEAAKNKSAKASLRPVSDYRTTIDGPNGRRLHPHFAPMVILRLL